MHNIKIHYGCENQPYGVSCYIDKETKIIKGFGYGNSTGQGATWLIPKIKVVSKKQLACGVSRDTKES